MAGSVPQHSHCQMCAKAIPYGETLCSEDCKQKYNGMLRRRKLILYLMYGILAEIIVVVLMSGNY